LSRCGLPKRTDGNALAVKLDIEAHLEYLDNCLEKLNQEIEELTQANQQWPEKVIENFGSEKS